MKKQSTIHKTIFKIKKSLLKNHTKKESWCWLAEQISCALNKHSIQEYNGDFNLPPFAEDSWSEDDEVALKKASSELSD